MKLLDIVHQLILSCAMNRNVDNLLITNKKEVRKAIHKSEEDIFEYIRIIREFLKAQSHLPEIPNDSIIEAFLITNKFSIEQTKEKLDMYYTIRTLLPECYDNKHPALSHMQDISNTLYVFPLPQLTEDMLRVNVLKIKGDPKYFDAYNFIGHQMNINEIRVHEEINLGDLLLVDLENIQMGHIFKFTPVHVKKAVLILEKVYSNRIKGIHIINAPTFADKLIYMMKSVLKQKLIKRIHIHSSLKDVLEHISADILPKDYGGNEMGLEELQYLWNMKLKQYKDRFDNLENMRVKQDERPAKLKNDEILGYHGSFKKLEVD
ncbi:unnamed protein product [Phaedon cochleariae]|uniref:CRAL-TRIO domain-containing protein n=1 Tax=Phaedon cochleariae TaxID=80249 RepID=A0A9P0GU93_PHACE|nr:unnamed protein product [Phaedon cochleariae]